MTELAIEGLCRAVDIGFRIARRGARLVGRALGAAEQLRDAALVATLPTVAPRIPWSKSTRLALRVLRGYDARPLLRIRTAIASVEREVADAATSRHEAALRAFFVDARKRAEA